MANVLVTGAYGFIGRHLCRNLALEGHYVTGIGHGNWSPAAALKWGVRNFFNCDVLRENLCLIQAKEEPDIVFHLAGGASVGSAFAHPREDFIRTVLGTMELLEWIRLDHPKTKLVVVSSAAVYGSNFNNQISESQVGTPFSPYGYNKKIMEMLCQSYGESYGLDYVVLRLFSVYGPGLRKQLLWDICTRLRSGESTIMLGGNGNEIRDWTHVSEVVDALKLVAFGNHIGSCNNTLNIGTGIGTTVKDISQMVIDAWCHRLGIIDRPKLVFTGESRKGDPFSLVADPTCLNRVGFCWNMTLSNGVDSFVDWFLSDCNKLIA